MKSSKKDYAALLLPGVVAGGMLVTVTDNIAIQVAALFAIGVAIGVMLTQLYCRRRCQ